MVNFVQETLPSNDEGERANDLRKMLENRRRAILGGIASMRNALVESNTGKRAMCDYGQTSDLDPGSDGELAIVGMKFAEIAKINEALARLEDGTYGICKECKENITASRLRALPFVVRCMTCEEQFEQGERERRARARTAQKKRNMGR